LENIFNRVMNGKPSTIRCEPVESERSDGDLLLRVMDWLHHLG
jgi:hypothetical protein